MVATRTLRLRVVLPAGCRELKTDLADCQRALSGQFLHPLCHRKVTDAVISLRGG
jgi:hypothetical protein